MSWVNAIEPLTDAGPLQRIPTLQGCRNEAGTQSASVYPIHAPIIQPFCKIYVLLLGDSGEFAEIPARRSRIRAPVAASLETANPGIESRPARVRVCVSPTERRISRTFSMVARARVTTATARGNRPGAALPRSPDAPSRH